MFSCTPVPPPVPILSGGTFVACGATWIVESDGVVVRERPLTRGEIEDAWRRYCRARFHSSRARRVCFRERRLQP